MEMKFMVPMQFLSLVFGRKYWFLCSRTKFVCFLVTTMAERRGRPQGRRLGQRQLRCHQ
jgi:hypothetical protein